MRIGSRSRSKSNVWSIIIGVWLVIGLLATLQRGYFSGGDANCAKLSTIAVTIVAGPLNYVGLNPQVKCPRPSR